MKHYKQIIYICLLMCVLLFPSVTSAEEIDNLYLVVCENEEVQDEIYTLHTYKGYPCEQEIISETICMIRTTNRYCQQIEDALSKDKNVKMYTKDEKLDMDLESYTYNKNQWYLYNPSSGIDIGATAAWSFFENKRPVTVAVIDGGIDIIHPDLEDNIWTNDKEIPFDGIDNDKNGFVDDIHGWNFCTNSSSVFNNEGSVDIHGTHVAGIIAAKNDSKGISGVASPADIKIMPIKIVDSFGGTISNFMKAVNYAKQNGATFINASIGVDESISSTLAEYAIQESGLMMICAAGNGNSKGKGYNIDKKRLFPASSTLKNVIGVANLGKNGYLHESSNFGTKSVEIAAPGENILSTIPYQSYFSLSGTSMATPVVSGVLALTYANSENMTVNESMNVVLKNVKKLTTLNGKVSSSGIPDAIASITNGEYIRTDKVKPTISITEKNVNKSFKKKIIVNITDITGNLSTASYKIDNGAAKTLSVSGNKAYVSFTTNKNISLSVTATDTKGNTITKTEKYKIETIKPKQKKYVIKVGESKKIKYKINNKNKAKKIRFYIKNKKIAKVNKKTGKVTGLKKGTTILTIKGKYVKQAKVKIKVKKR